MTRKEAADLARQLGYEIKTVAQFEKLLERLGLWVGLDMETAEWTVCEGDRPNEIVRARCA